MSRPGCPACGAQLDFFAEVSCAGWVSAESDPQGKVRADLLLECDECGAIFNTFVELDAFQRVDRRGERA